MKLPVMIECTFTAGQLMNTEMTVTVNLTETEPESSWSGSSCEFFTVHTLTVTCWGIG